MHYITNQFYGIKNEGNFLKGLKNVLENLTANTGIYCSDNLITFERNLTFLSDKKFIKFLKMYSQDDKMLSGIGAKGTNAYTSNEKTVYSVFSCYLNNLVNPVFDYIFLLLDLLL